MDILLNGKAVDALSTIVHTSKARELGKSYCFKLQSSIPRQLFEVVIQAAVRGKVIAREVIRPIRKDVTAKCVSFSRTICNEDLTVRWIHGSEKSSNSLIK